ncbi:MAG: hypothetical protein ABI432_04515 [Flavobacteriales bacterium]
MKNTKDAARNTRLLWGRPKWRGRELSMTTFFLLSICVAGAIVAVYYLFKLHVI